MKKVFIHYKAREVIRDFSNEVKKELGTALLKLQLGTTLGLPLSRPMPAISSGCSELRLRDGSGIQRVFYYTNSAKGIFIFHAFTKKTQKTDHLDLVLGQKRLKEMLRNEE